MIRLITFDVTNTILRFRQLPSVYYANVAARYDIHLDKSIVEGAFRIAFKNQNMLSPNFGQNNGGWERWWMQVIFNTISLSGGSIRPSIEENIYCDIINIFTTAEAYEVDPGFYPLINKLSKIPVVVVGTLSNTDDRLETILKNLKIYNYFNFVATSYNGRYLKPHPEIFKYALKCAGNDIKAEEALHIGDNINLDYIAAKKAGWRSILVSRSFEEDCSESSVIIDRETMVKSLYELNSLIDNYSFIT